MRTHAVTVFTLAGLLPLTASADVVHLKSGGAFSGRIVSRSATTIEMDIGAGRVGIPIANVVRVDLSRRDDLMRLVAELVLSRARLDDNLRPPRLHLGKAGRAHQGRRLDRHRRRDSGPGAARALPGAAQRTLLQPS